MFQYNEPIRGFQSLCVHQTRLVYLDLWRMEKDHRRNGMVGKKVKPTRKWRVFRRCVRYAEGSLGYFLDSLTHGVCPLHQAQDISSTDSPSLQRPHDWTCGDEWRVSGYILRRRFLCCRSPFCLPIEYHKPANQFLWLVLATVCLIVYAILAVLWAIQRIVFLPHLWETIKMIATYPDRYRIPLRTAIHPYPSCRTTL